MTNKQQIPDGLVLETNPKIINSFPSVYSTLPPLRITKSDYIAREEAYMENLDFISEDRSAKKKQDPEHVKTCSWGRARIKRFIAQYVRTFKDRRNPYREKFLKDFEDTAREANLKLPTADEIRAINTEPKKERFISGLVDLNTENRVGDYKYYWDGGQYVAYLVGENKAVERELHERTKWDDLFDTLYPVVKAQYDEKNKKKSEVEIIRIRIENELVQQFYDIYDYDDQTENETCHEFIARKLYNKSAAYSMRKKRFYRKKDQVRWTAWWTITYDEKLFGDEQTFRRVLLNYFRNKSVRNQWRIMGVFEHGEDNGRLHFHGFFYIPDGKHVGELVEVERYSTKRGCMEKYIENTEIREKFGINKYEDISEALKSDVKAMAKYTSKMLGYMEKGETVFYTRHIPMEFMGTFNSHDMLMYFCITCKRLMKRYVVNPHLIVRRDIEMHRRKPVKTKVKAEAKDESDPYDIGLLDEAA